VKIRESFTQNITEFKAGNVSEKRVHVPHTKMTQRDMEIYAL